MSQVDELKSAVAERLSDLDVVIGWRSGFDPLHATPFFMKKEADLDNLVWNPMCVQNLATYLTGFKDKKIGVCVKGCDSRSVVELMQEGLIERDKVVVFGLPCKGVVDLAKIKHSVGDLGLVKAAKVEGDKLVLTLRGGEEKSLSLEEHLADKCGVCAYPNPLTVDVMVGAEETPRAPEGNDYLDIEAFLEKPVEERLAFWREQMNRCIRCYACRNACPLCVCRDHCVAVSREPKWMSQETSTQEKMMFQVIHAMHLAGRCTECGECQRACPMDIPILLLKKMLNRELKELFAYEAGTNPEATPPLYTFQVEEDNINERGW